MILVVEYLKKKSIDTLEKYIFMKLNKNSNTKRPLRF